MTTNTTRFQQADDLSLCVSHVCDLASLLGCGCWDDYYPEPIEWLEDVLEEDDFYGRARALFPFLRPTADTSDLEPWMVMEALIDSGHRGFLVQVKSPIMTPMKSGGMRYSWGRIHLTWCYGDTFDEAWEEAKRWAQECHDADAKKGGAA